MRNGNEILLAGPELCIQYMRIAHEDADTVAKCMKTYAGPETNSIRDVVTYVAARLLNAFKRILPFIQSDWQKARNIILAQAHSNAELKVAAKLLGANLESEAANSPRRKQYEKTTTQSLKEVDRATRGAVDKLLDLCFQAHCQNISERLIHKEVLLLDVDHVAEQVLKQTLIPYINQDPKN